MIFFVCVCAAVICLLILKTHRSALFSAFGIQDRRESSSVALIASAETRSILMSRCGRPDTFIRRAQRGPLGARTDRELCRGH